MNQSNDYIIHISINQSIDQSVQAVVDSIVWGQGSSRFYGLVSKQ